MLWWICAAVKLMEIPKLFIFEGIINGKYQ